MATLAEKEEGFNYRLDIDSPSYLMPDKVTRVILEECHDKHYPLPRNVGGYAYAIYCSLANAYAKAIASLKAITGLDYASLDIVGGGSKNLYLNKLIAEKTGKKVILGSPEGTSLGNLALQALCLGDFKNYRAMKDAIIETKDR
jgi:rhamnulokinase